MARKKSRRKILKAAGIGLIGGLAGCSGDGGDGDGDGGDGDGSDGGDGGGSDGGDGGGDGGDGGMTTTTSDGSSGGSEELNFILSNKGQGQGGLFAQSKAAHWYTRDMDNVSVNIIDGQFDPTEQNTRTINAMSENTDGILLNPQDAKASKQIVQEAASMDVPVFNFDTATLSQDISIGVLFGQYAGGRVVAERFKNEIMPEIDADTINLIGAVFGFESTTSQQRLNGFTDNIPDNVNMINTVESVGTADEAAQPILNALRGTNEEVHGIYSNNVGSGLGALTALKQLDQYYKRDHSDHVYAFGIDGGITLNKRIKSGYYDFAVDQPLHMYAPLTLELMFTHLGVDPPNSGARPDSLPTADDGQMTTDDLSIADKEVFGTNAWSNQFWAPAEMTTYRAEDTEWWPWMRVKNAMITQDNADAPYLYGNVLAGYRESQ
jgi:ribose transport system substrate-binding protein